MTERDNIEIRRLHSQIRSQLEPMFAQAEREGLWFNSAYQDLWFSPKELKAEQARGRFVWGPENWSLRDPQEHLKSIEAAIAELKSEKERFLARMNK